MKISPNYFGSFVMAYFIWVLCALHFVLVLTAISLFGVNFSFGEIEG
jgi:hypothetical protein